MRRVTAVAVFAWIGALVLSLLVAIPTAQADDHDQPGNNDQNNPGISGLEVAITSLLPLDPQPKKKLAVTGTVTNRTDSSINTISVDLRLGQSPVTSVQAVIDLDSNTSIASTRSLPDGQATQEFGNRNGLAPNGSAPFSFSIPFSKIAMPSSGIYALQVQAVDVNNSGHSGFTQTFLPWYPKDRDYTPINVLMYWPLATIPNKTSTSLLMTDQTPTSLDTNGRLNGLLSVPGAKGAATWVVDPSLIQTVAAMSNGYEYLNEQGQVTKGTRDDAATDWLALAKQTLQGAQVKAMPYAHSDITALVANDLKSNAAQSVRSAAPTLSTDLGTSVNQTLTWVPNGRVSAEATSVASRAGSPLAVISRDALTSTFEYERSRNPVTTVKTDRDPVPALLADPYLSQAFAQEATTPTEQVRLRQRILALIGAWPASTTPTSVVVAPPTLWAPNKAVLGQVLKTITISAWSKASTQDAVLAAHESSGEHELQTPSGGATTSRGTTNYFQGITAAQKRLGQFDTVLGNPTEFTNPVHSALLRAESSVWSGNRRNGRALLRTINDQITQGTDKVRAVASDIVSVAGDSGAIPITLVNDFDQPATVRVRLEATPSVRLESDSDTLHKIPARRKISVEIPIKVAGSEDLPVHVQLVTPAGEPWGTPEAISVRNSAYARAATWVVAAAFALLAGLLTVNSIRRRRANKAEEAAKAAESGEPDESSDAAAQADSAADDSDSETADDQNEETSGTVHQLDHWRDPRD